MDLTHEQDAACSVCIPRTLCLWLYEPCSGIHFPHELSAACSCLPRSMHVVSFLSLPPFSSFPPLSLSICSPPYSMIADYGFGGSRFRDQNLSGWIYIMVSKTDTIEFL